jgi:hypothetical protein
VALAGLVTGRARRRPLAGRPGGPRPGHLDLERRLPGRVAESIRPRAASSFRVKFTAGGRVGLLRRPSGTCRNVEMELYDRYIYLSLAYDGLCRDVYLTYHDTTVTGRHIPVTGIMI